MLLTLNDCVSFECMMHILTFSITVNCHICAKYLYMSNSLAQAQDLITIISLITALIYFYPILILLLIISIIPTLLNELKFSNSNYKLTSRMAPERRQLDYMRVIGASDVTAKEVKLFVAWRGQ